MLSNTIALLLPIYGHGIEPLCSLWFHFLAWTWIHLNSLARQRSTVDFPEFSRLWNSVAASREKMRISMRKRPGRMRKLLRPVGLMRVSMNAVCLASSFCWHGWVIISTGWLVVAATNIWQHFAYNEFGVGYILQSMCWPKTGMMTIMNRQQQPSHRSDLQAKTTCTTQSWNELWAVPQWVCWFCWWVSVPCVAADCVIVASTLVLNVRTDVQESIDCGLAHGEASYDICAKLVALVTTRFASFLFSLM